MADLKEVWGTGFSLKGKTAPRNNVENIRRNLMDTNYLYSKYNSDKLSYFTPEEQQKLPREVLKTRKQKKIRPRKSKYSKYNSYMTLDDEGEEEGDADLIGQRIVENFENGVTDGSIDCASFIKHISKCKKCRAEMQRKFGGSTHDDMMDIAIYALTGVFVLILIEVFVNIGKRLR